MARRMEALFVLFCLDLLPPLQLLLCVGFHDGVLTEFGLFADSSASAKPTVEESSGVSMGETNSDPKSALA